jgi:hypothetical protein
MEEIEVTLTSKQALHICAMILDSLSRDIISFRSAIVPARLDGIKTQLIAHVRQASEQTGSNPNTTEGNEASEHPAIEAYQGAIKDWENMTKYEVSWPRYRCSI